MRDQINSKIMTSNDIDFILYNIIYYTIKSTVGNDNLISIYHIVLRKI